MATLARELESAFRALNKARLDLELQVDSKEAVHDRTYGYILDSSAIDIDSVNKLNPEVAVRLAFPGERDSEVRLTYTNARFARHGVKEIACLHGLRTSYDPTFQ